MGTYPRDQSPHWKSLDIAERTLIDDIDALDKGIANVNITTAKQDQWRRENVAVLKIQRWFRLRETKMDVIFKVGPIFETNAAIVIQSFFRGEMARKRVRNKMSKARKRVYKLKHGVLAYDPKLFDGDLKRVVEYCSTRDAKELVHFKTKMRCRTNESRHDHNYMNWWHNMPDEDFNIQTDSPRWSVVSDLPFLEDSMDTIVNATTHCIMRNVLADQHIIEKVTSVIVRKASARAADRHKKAH